VGRIDGLELQALDSGRETFLVVDHRFWDRPWYRMEVWMTVGPSEGGVAGLLVLVNARE
jgi:hypothetical protein